MDGFSIFFQDVFRGYENVKFLLSGVFENDR